MYNHSHRGLTTVILWQIMTAKVTTTMHLLELPFCIVVLHPSLQLNEWNFRHSFPCDSEMQYFTAIL